MLLCHIVGINNKLKNDFIKAISNSLVIIIDIDDISKKIMFDQKFFYLYNQLM